MSSTREGGGGGSGVARGSVSMEDGGHGGLAEGFGVVAESEMDRFMSSFDRDCVALFEKQLQAEQTYHRTTTFAFSDIIPFAKNGMQAIHQDSFTQCFQVGAVAVWVGDGGCVCHLEALRMRTSCSRPGARVCLCVMVCDTMCDGVMV